MQKRSSDSCGSCSMKLTISQWSSGMAGRGELEETRIYVSTGDWKVETVFVLRGGDLAWLHGSVLGLPLVPVCAIRKRSAASTVYRLE